ncbi:unnamed protein product, partial [Discosporangium mesarthrocarpum]
GDVVASSGTTGHGAGQNDGGGEGSVLISMYRDAALVTHHLRAISEDTGLGGWVYGASKTAAGAAVAAPRAMGDALGAASGSVASVASDLTGVVCRRMGAVVARAPRILAIAKVWSR